MLSNITSLNQVARSVGVCVTAVGLLAAVSVSWAAEDRSRVGSSIGALANSSPLTPSKLPASQDVAKGAVCFLAESIISCADVLAHEGVASGERIAVVSP